MHCPPASGWKSADARPPAPLAVRGRRGNPASRPCARGDRTPAGAERDPDRLGAARHRGAGRHGLRIELDAGRCGAGGLLLRIRRAGHLWRLLPGAPGSCLRAPVAPLDALSVGDRRHAAADGPDLLVPLQVCAAGRLLSEGADTPLRVPVHRPAGTALRGALRGVHRPDGDRRLDRPHPLRVGRPWRAGQSDRRLRRVHDLERISGPRRGRQDHRHPAHHPGAGAGHLAGAPPAGPGGERKHRGAGPVALLRSRSRGPHPRGGDLDQGRRR